MSDFLVTAHLPGNFVDFQLYTRIHAAINFVCPTTPGNVSRRVRIQCFILMEERYVFYTQLRLSKHLCPEMRSKLSFAYERKEEEDEEKAGSTADDDCSNAPRIQGRSMGTRY